MQAFFMSNYIKIDINGISNEEQNILIAQLSDFGFYAFEQDENCLSAYIKEQDFNPENLISFLPVNKKFDKTIIEEENWNSKWESSFQPVLIDDFALIRAAFHEPADNVKHDLVITPKMSFGTGHHATTFMMISAMQNMDFRNKAVLDYGTGTGVLAILACKLGAASVLAIDNDSWSIENAVENTAVNNCQDIRIELRDSMDGLARFDLILANINLRVILENMGIIRQHLTESGVFTGSGVLESDEEKIRNRAAECDLIFERLMTKDNWMSFSLKNSQS